MYWREREDVYPTLARLARDLLSVPASGASVERLSSKVEQICGAQSGKGDISVVQDLPLYIFVDKMLDKRDARESAIEDSIAWDVAASIDPISDDEAQEDESTLDENSWKGVDTCEEIMSASDVDTPVSEDSSPADTGDRTDEMDGTEEPPLPPPVARLFNKFRRISGLYTG